MVTIKDVARVAGVSTATVSRVVHGGGQVGDDCRARVKKIIEELGYRPNSNARALVSKTSTTLGVVTPRLSMAFFGCLAAGAEIAARKNNYKLLMSNSLYETKTELEAIESLREHSCDAIVLHSEYSDEKTLIDLAKKIPGLVLINRFIPKLAHRCVWLDNLAGAQEITRYLIDKGHKDIAIITSVYQNSDPELRTQGVKKTMRDAGLKFDEDLLAESTANTKGGEDAVQMLLDRGVKFTAVIAYNDLMAVDAMNRLQDAGIAVPESVSVVGFDNLYISRSCRPLLTTMNYPIEEMGTYAAELAIKLSTDSAGAHSQTHLFMPELVERNSVKAL